MEVIPLLLVLVLLLLLLLLLTSFSTYFMPLMQEHLKAVEASHMSRLGTELKKRDSQGQELLMKKIDHYNSLEKKLQVGLQKLKKQQKILDTSEDKVGRLQRQNTNKDSNNTNRTNRNKYDKVKTKQNKNVTNSNLFNNKTHINNSITN